MINFALAKGRLAEESAEILARAGVDVSVLKGNTRKLVLKSADGAYGFFLVKPYDVPVYVEAGVADMASRVKILFSNRAEIFTKCSI